MKWVTRARPKTDRIACPWLIRRFIDPAAEILYVPAEQVLDVAKAEGAHSFDARGVEYDHRDGKCTLEVLIDAVGLGDAALSRLARIVHAADIQNDLHTDPAGPGLLAIGVGGLDVEADDHRLLERGSFVVRRPVRGVCPRRVGRFAMTEGDPASGTAHRLANRIVTNWAAAGIAPAAGAFMLEFRN
jgi:hypothetical protein